MRIKAALYNADHLEYGLVTIPFPIPQDQYNDTIKMLEALDIGDPRAKDCMVEEIEGCVPSLKCLEGHRINVDELDYLVKRLDSFSDGELAQFQGMAAKMGLSDMTDLINLTFCCQQATVITDFSDLEQIGRDHYMNLHGGCVSTEELEELDSMETALLLISENEGTKTATGLRKGWASPRTRSPRWTWCAFWMKSRYSLKTTVKEDLENDTVQYSEPPDLEDLLGEDWDEEQEDGPSIEM